MATPFLLWGSIATLTGVIFGAFGAHGLKALITPELLSVYQTGVHYQIWHGLGLILLHILTQQTPTSTLLIRAGAFMLAGIILFSGSLYLLAILKLHWLGMITPIGGLCFISAWTMVVIYAAKNQASTHPHQ
ncbi:DUF423 domain-containing protein [Methylocucumis oryzae]|uniref:Membrane protein n=1 Tax=Methylocucumis oryzae TaxID=1632867 RepID=A0A0F3IIE2_9GAMM|nr:DUF423 domain-containing protein [Methylocucumis oryzae]KJV05234.1 membrane protein [Methylocucumis oryzae]